MKNSLLFALALGCASIAKPQSIVDVQAMLDAAKSAQSVLVTITASQGDLTSCKIVKYSGPAPHIGLSCTPGDGKSVLSQANLTLGTTLQTLPFGYGDVLCLVVANPTAAAVTVGSIGSVPASGLAWQCATNISAGGIVTGQGPLVSGTASWP
jgi:hypothetical protein